MTKKEIDKPNIILDGRKFDWLDSEIESFLEYWQAYSANSSNTIEIVNQIAKDMKQDSDDLLLLALHLAIKGRIYARFKKDAVRRRKSQQSS